jgi:hypothetical protein
VQAIPLCKTVQIPLQAVDQDVGSVSGTISAIGKFFKQMGVWTGSIKDKATVKLGDLIVFVHCDLSALEKMLTMIKWRSAETIPELRFQSLVPVLGLFHLKMACADAIWRILVHRKGKGSAAKNDSNSLISLIGKLWPDKTGTFMSKKGPGFCRMHKVILHIGIVSRLEVWCLRVAEPDLGHVSLEVFAAAHPLFERLQRIVEELAVSDWSQDSNLQELREKPNAERDRTWENIGLQDELFVLYEELSYAMNKGDVGRLECCFIPWIVIFKACGKHKYVKHMYRTLWSLHFVYGAAVA